MVEGETQVVQPVMTASEVDDLISRVYPQIWVDGGRSFAIEAIEPGLARLRMFYAERHLRPGGTISGPSMMALADLAMWTVVLGHIGPLELSVTTNLTINFLRKPAQRDILADARLLKLGKRLAVGDVTLRSDGDEAAVAHATCTYAIPSP
jgi:uncharacterized protein (TIGR00369 family)